MFFTYMQNNSGACVIAAKFYADNIGAPPEQTKDLIKRIADIDIAMRLQPAGNA